MATSRHTDDSINDHFQPNPTPLSHPPHRRLDPCERESANTSCPFARCGGKPGFPCRNEYGTTLRPHNERMVAYARHRRVVVIERVLDARADLRVVEGLSSAIKELAEAIEEALRDL